jgi:hypothetical protein
MTLQLLTHVQPTGYDKSGLLCQALSIALAAYIVLTYCSLSSTPYLLLTTAFYCFLLLSTAFYCFLLTAYSGALEHADPTHTQGETEAAAGRALFRPARARRRLRPARILLGFR